MSLRRGDDLVARRRRHQLAGVLAREACRGQRRLPSWLAVNSRARRVYLLFAFGTDDDLLRHVVLQLARVLLLLRLEQQEGSLLCRELLGGGGRWGYLWRTCHVVEDVMAGMVRLD